MAAIWRLALLEVLTVLWTLSRADVVGVWNATTASPFPTLNATLSGTATNSTSGGAVVGRVAVALGIAGAVGAILFLLKKKCPRGSAAGGRPAGLELQRLTGEASDAARPSASRDSSSDSDGALRS